MYIHVLYTSIYVYIPLHIIMFVLSTIPALAPTLGLSEQSELIDPVVITGAINYLINQQESSGRFPVIGRLHNYYLLVIVFSVVLLCIYMLCF